MGGSGFVGWCGAVVGGGVGPSGVECVGHVEEVEESADDEVDEVVDAFGEHVEAGVGGSDDGAGLCGGGHVAYFDEAEGHFAVGEDESSSFFECDAGGAVHKVVGDALCDGGECVVGAGADDHAVVAE